jgi:Tfp pilus assembly protein FimT
VNLVHPLRRHILPFSLIELIVVCIILSVVAMVILPNLGGLSPESQLNRECRALRGTLQWLQGEAISTGLPHLLIYDLEANQLLLQRKTSTMGKATPHQLHALPESIRLTQITTPKRTFRDQRLQIEFSPLGLMEIHEIHLGHRDGLTAALRVHSLTGDLSIVMEGSR